MKRRKLTEYCQLTAYRAFCEAAGAPAFPADDAVFNAFLRSLDGRVGDTYKKQRLTVQHAHRNAGLRPPRVDPEVRRIERAAPSRRRPLPPIPKAAAREMLAKLDPHAATEARDGAICILRFVHGYEVKEMRELRIEDVAFTDRGVILAGHAIADGDDGRLSEWLRAWLAHLGRTSGPLFVCWYMRGYWGAHAMTYESFIARFQKAARRAGLAPTVRSKQKNLSQAVIERRAAR